MMARAVPAARPTRDLDLAIGRALEKDRELRYQSAADLAADLRRLQRPLSSAPLTAVQAPKPRRTHPWRTAAIAALVLSSVLAVALVVRRPVADVPTTRFTVGPPPNSVFTAAGLGQAAMTVSVSPDGRRVLYLANSPGAPRIWMRSIDSVDATPLDDTDGAVAPFWSPDGRSIAFFVERTLKRKELPGGTARTLATVVAIPRGGAWSAEGDILVGSLDSGIFRVSASGGTPAPVTTPDAASGEQWHRFPQLLPDGRHFLYLAGTSETRAMLVGSLVGRLKKRVLEVNGRATYTDAGFLLFVGDNGALLARPFDAGRLEVSGESVLVASQVALSSTFNAAYAVGASTLVYSQRIAETSRLTWFDRSGQAGGTIGTPGQYLGVRLSPDGNTVAVSRLDPAVNAPDIWLLDVARGAETRFTYSPTIDVSPVWSPDGSRLAFTTSNGAQFRMDQRPTAGGADASTLFASAEAPNPDDWSADGQFIVYSTTPTQRNNDLRLLRLSDRQSTTLLASRFSEYQGRLSPDGRWLAYTADDTGRPEIYVRPFPAGPSSVLISIGGGTDAAWRRDGKELFYLAPDGSMMSVALTLSDAVKANQPVVLFRARVPADRPRTGTSYAATADGRRFLVPTADGDRTQPAVTVILNWAKAGQR